MLYRFTQAQFTALIATAIDFLSLIFFVEIFQLWLPAATAWAALNGAITNFLLNRNWVFSETKGQSFSIQALRYALVSLGSLLLNTLGVTFLTRTAEFFYIASKIVTALIVAVLFNYPLQRYFVFRNKVN